jgi:hypothetical protein
LKKQLTEARNQIASLSINGSTEADTGRMLLDLVPKPLASRLEELLKQCDSLKEVVESLTLEEQSELAKGLVRLDVQLGLRPKPT